MKLMLIALLYGASLIFPTQGFGIILMGTGDPTVNTTPPSDDRGWKYQGTIRNPGAGVSVLATVIGKRYILSTKHISIQTNAEFVLNGVTNTVIRVFVDTNSELVVCKMNRQNAFGTSSTNWAPLYESTSLVGKSCAIFGMGQQRGELLTSQIENVSPFVITNLGGSSSSVEFRVIGGDQWMRFAIQQSTNLDMWETMPGIHYAPSTISITKSDYPQAFFRVMAITTITNGWLLGPHDLVKRWGGNTVESISGEYLITAFDAGSADPNECTLTPYDSSGGLFILDTDGKWKIAGINYGSFYWPWSLDMGINLFSAALFDQTGLWYGYFPSSYYNYPTGKAVPTWSYHTSVSPRAAWIRWAMTQ